MKEFQLATVENIKSKYIAYNDMLRWLSCKKEEFTEVFGSKSYNILLNDSLEMADHFYFLNKKIKRSIEKC